MGIGITYVSYLIALRGDGGVGQKFRCSAKGSAAGREGQKIKSVNLSKKEQSADDKRAHVQGVYSACDEY